MMNQQARVQPPQSANFANHNGAYSNRQPSNRQTGFSQQPAGGNHYYLNMLTGNQKHLPTNMQSGKPSSMITYGFQQDLHQNSAQNSSSPSNMMKANTTHPQQGMVAHWSQSVTGKQFIRTHNGNFSDVQQCGNWNYLFNDTNGESTKPVLAYSKTATMSLYEKVLYPGTLAPAAAHNRTPPSYQTAISQSFRNNSITTNSSASRQNLHVSSVIQKTHQYLHNNGREATSSIKCDSYSRQHENSKRPLNPAVDTQEEILSRQIIARIADDLRNSFPAGSDGRPPVYTSSPYKGVQMVNEVRMTESHQNKQPVTATVTESYNSNASHSFPLNSGHCLPKTTHSVISTQQSSAPNVFYSTATRDGNGNGNVGSLSDASQLMQFPEGISPQRNESQTSLANNRERLEMLSAVKVNDCSIHSSPGRTRAVAVVQPLSHESYQVASKQTPCNTPSPSSEGFATEESLSNPEKLFISPKDKQGVYRKVESYLCLENPKQKSSNKSAIRHSVASNDSTFVSSSDSAAPQDSQKQSCADDSGSELRVDQHGAPTAQQSVTSEVPLSQSCDKDKREMPKDPKGDFELSSLPTTTWTHAALTRLIQQTEETQMKANDSSEFDLKSKLSSLHSPGFWQNFLYKYRSGWYVKILTDALSFNTNNMKPDTVILSEVKQLFGKQLKNYHVLKDNEVYSELPYKSSWLNVNEQLDDIDKMFGFPGFLKLRLHVPESDSQPDQVETDNSIPSQTVREESDKMLSSTELEPVDSSEEKQDSTVEATATQMASPNKMESDDSSDPYYSFGIQILSPEEAKNIFEQIKSNQLKSMDIDNQPERVTESEGEPVDKLEYFCCIPRWKEIILGSSTASLSECQCKYKKSPEDELCAIRSDSKFHSATEGENQAKGGEDVGSQVMTYELCNQLSDTIDFTEDDDKPHLYSDKNISQISINDSQTSITIINDSGDDLSRSYNEIPNQMPDFENDSEQAQVKLTESCQSSGSEEKETERFSKIQSDPEVDCVQDQLKSTESTQSCIWVSGDKEIESISSTEVASQMSDLEENCGPAHLTSTQVSSLETEEQTQIGATGALQTTWSDEHETVERKRKRLSSHDGFYPLFKKCKSLGDVDSQPVLEGASKCATDNELSASNARTVELMLFGSTTQDKCVANVGRKVPKVVTVNLSPLKRTSIETVPTGEYSLKRSLFEKWRRSLPPAKIRHRFKVKTQRYFCTFASVSGVSLKKAETVGPANTEELPVSSETRISNGSTRLCLRLKRRRALSNRLKHGEKKTKKHTASLNQPADQERSNAESESHAVMPLQNNDVLKFSVLPKTFNFSDESSGRKETDDPFPDKPDIVEGTDKSHNKTLGRGTWLPKPDKKYCPLLPSCPKTYSLFHEFQKKHKEKMQTSANE